MKKFIGIFTGILALFVLAIIAFPYLYKDKIDKYIKTEINKKINATVDYKDLNLSLLKDFPNLHVKIENIIIDGKAPFDTIRLAEIPEFNFSLDFKKLFTDENLEIKKIGLINPNFHIVVLKDGTANYNIMKESEENDKQEVDNSFDMKIQEVQTKNLNLTYDDRSMNLKMKIHNLNQTGEGNFKKNQYEYITHASAESLDVLFDDIHYLNNVKTDLTGKMVITNDFNTYQMEDIKARLNDLGLTSNLFFDLQGDDIKMDIHYQSEENNLKKFLSLIPSAYMPDLPNLQTGGEASLKGYVKGIYNENNYPAFGVNFKVKDGRIKYPDLPESINNIQVLTLVDFPGGNNLDKTSIEMPDIRFSIAKNPVKGYLKVHNPTTDPFINTAFNGKVNFSKLKQALKLEESGIKKLEGQMAADFKLSTRMSAIEKEAYDKIKASGSFKIDGMKIETDSLPYSISISKADVLVTPAYLDMKQFKSQVGNSDFSLQGKLENYLAYALKKNKELKADFELESNKIDLNQFMSEESESTTSSDSLSVIKIPDNLNIRFKGSAAKVLYKDMILNNVKGDITIKDEKAILNTVLSKALGGEMSLKGSYDTSKEKPQSSLKMEMNKVSIPQTASTLSTFSYYAPALKKVNGQLFSLLEMQMELDEQMNPIFSTLDLNGLLETANINIAGIEVLSKIADLLKLNELKNPKIDKVKASFIIEDGNLKIKPFDFKMNGMKSKFQGKVSLERKIDFVMEMDIPKEKLGSKANSIMKDMLGNLSKYGLDKGTFPDIIKIKFKITGDYNKPIVKPVFSGYEGKSMSEVVTQVVTDKVEENIDKAKEQAIQEAQKQGEKLIAEAKAQGEKIKLEAKKIADRIRSEAKKQADNLIKEAGNDPFKSLVAKKAAKKIITSANQKAERIEKEADQKAELLVNQAKQQATNLINKAKATGN
jgi:F0F1-type ATP synthase membrane subunit b/b'